MDTAVDGIITINASGIIISVNKAVTKILGWHESELLGASAGIVAPESLKDTFVQYIDDYIRHARA